MGKDCRVGILSRGMAFCAIGVFLGGSLVGSLLPESGNILARILKLPYESGHVFNPCFLALGITGIVLACAFRCKMDS